MQYFKAKQKKCSNGKEIKYTNQPEIQNYLLPNDIFTLEKQRKLFKFRSRMNFLPSNFPSSNPKVACEAPCKKKLTNKHLYKCKILNKSEPNRLNYKKIFNGSIEKKNEVLSVINSKYEKWRKNYEYLIPKKMKIPNN